MLHSKKKQDVVVEDNRIMFKFRMGGINKNVPVYKVGYSLSLHDNSWYVEFYTANDERLDEIPVSARDRFKELDRNLKEYRIYRTCSQCDKYHYDSSVFRLNYFDSTLSDEFTLNNEYFLLGKEGKEIKLFQNLARNTSTICFGNSVKREDWIYLKSLIDVKSADEAFDRINNLIIFS